MSRSGADTAGPGSPRTGAVAGDVEHERLEEHRRTVETRSGPVSVIDVGQGPPALFVHGVATNALLWRHVLEQLAEDRRCLAIDLPGHGHTPPRPGASCTLPGLAELVLATSDALGLERFDLVANDTGGAVAQVLAARHPDRLRTLVLCDCDTHDNLPPDAFRPMVEMAEKAELAPLGVALMDDLAAARATAFGLAYQDPALPPDDVLRTFLEPVVGTLERGRHFEQMLLALKAEDLLEVEPALLELRVPTLVVWGTDDAFFELKWAYWLKDTVPGVTEVVEIEGGRLFLPDERAGEFLSHVRRHWSVHPIG